MHEIETRWKEIKESVRTERELSDVAYNTWVAPLEIFKKHRIFKEKSTFKH